MGFSLDLEYLLIIGLTVGDDVFVQNDSLGVEIFPTIMPLVGLW